jgi:NADH dehydrogenase FAD-containing subunit
LCIYNRSKYRESLSPYSSAVIREGTVAVNNIISIIEGKIENNKKIFDYKTKGMIATIGKRGGVGKILGLEVQGLLAW